MENIFQGCPHIFLYFFKYFGDKYGVHGSIFGQFFGRSRNHSKSISIDQGSAQTLKKPHNYIKNKKNQNIVFFVSVFWALLDLVLGLVWAPEHVPKRELQNMFPETGSRERVPAEKGS